MAQGQNGERVATPRITQHHPWVASKGAGRGGGGIQQHTATVVDNCTKKGVSSYMLLAVVCCCTVPFLYQVVCRWHLCCFRGWLASILCFSLQCWRGFFLSFCDCGVWCVFVPVGGARPRGSATGENTTSCLVLHTRYFDRYICRYSILKQGGKHWKTRLITDFCFNAHLCRLCS